MASNVELIAYAKASGLDRKEIKTFCVMMMGQQEHISPIDTLDQLETVLQMIVEKRDKPKPAKFHTAKRGDGPSPHIKVYMSDESKALLKAAAELKGTTVSDYVRDIIEAEIDKQIDENRI